MHLNLTDLLDRALPLTPWAEADNIPWDDPEFSARMLEVHLDPDTPLASRPPAQIEAHVAWIHGHLMGGQPGRLLDLGCGPGLYLHQLAHLGHTCEGLDFGPASIQHAAKIAEAEGLDCRFHLEDLRRAALPSGFDLVTLIYGQINVFRRAEALDLLRRAYGALREGGRLLLEVQAEAHLQSGPPTSWFTAPHSVFSPRPHLALHERAWIAAARACVERWHVVDLTDASTRRFSLTTEAYADGEVEAILEAVGFRNVERLEALPGEPTPSPMFALVAQR